MIDCGEHIEEMIVLFRESGMPLIPSDIAAGVLDHLYAQGEVTLDEIDEGVVVEQVTSQVECMLTPAELAQLFVRSTLMRAKKGRP